MNENPQPSPSDGGKAPPLRSHDGAPFAPHDGDPSAPPDPAAVMAVALDWVEQNQTLAMLGAFALGVFIGTMMRD